MACHARPCGEDAGSRGGGDVIDVEGQEDAPSAPRARKRKAPAQQTQVCPPPRPRVQRSERHVSGREGVWLNGCRSSRNTRRGGSAR